MERDVLLISALKFFWYFHGASVEELTAIENSQQEQESFEILPFFLKKLSKTT
jgi:hypothetical protein